MAIRDKMNQLDKWAMDRPLSLVIMAQQSATGAETLFKLVESIRIEEELADYEITWPFKKWLNLYEDHRHLEKRVIEIFKVLGGK